MDQNISKIAVSLLGLSILAACTKFNGSIQPMNASIDDVQQPTVAKFDPALQNEIFVDILNEVQGGSCDDQAAGDPETRLMTPQEYILSVENVFGQDFDDDALKGSLPAQTVVLGYSHLRQFNILSPEKLETYVKVNGSVVSKYMEQAGQQALQCGASPRDCAKRWLEAKLPLAWRMDVDSAQIDKELAFFESLGSNEDAFATMIERALLSPYFLYRRNFGLDGQLSSWEIASTLSDSLWGGAFNGDLETLSKNGQLSSKDAILSQVNTMIGDQKFYTGLKTFVNSWLDTKIIAGKNFMDLPEFNPSEQLTADLGEEAAAYMYYLIRQGQDSVEGIFSSPFTVGSNEEAQTYGFTNSGEQLPAGSPDGFSKLDFPAERQGLLSQPSFALVSSNVAKTNPALRGKHVLEKFLCHNLETPENLGDVVANTQFDQNVSVIEAFDKATNIGSCGECHKFVNGAGFGMENLSSTGFMQEIDNHQKPVVPDGQLLSLSGQSVPFNGIAGLNTALGGMQDTEVCLVVQTFRMVYGRLEEKKDVCTIASTYKKAKAESLKFQDIFVHLLTHDSFIKR